MPTPPLKIRSLNITLAGEQIALQLRVKGGALVQSVPEGSQAATAGLLPTRRGLGGIVTGCASPPHAACPDDLPMHIPMHNPMHNPLHIPLHNPMLVRVQIPVHIPRHDSEA